MKTQPLAPAAPAGFCRRCLLAAACLLSLGLAPGLAGASSRLIVRFEEPEITARAQPSAAQQAQLQQAGAADLRFRRRLSGGAMLLETPAPLTATALQNLVQRIQDQPGVRYAQPDRRYQPSQVAFSDADFDRQWYLQPPTIETAGIDAIGAWSTFQRLLDDPVRPVVAVLDSGIRPHPEFDGQLVANGADGSGLPGHDFISEDSPGVALTANDGDGRDGDPEDPGDGLTEQDIVENQDVFPREECVAKSSSWHGTAVTGIIGASANTSFFGSGTVGVHLAPRLLPVRVLGRCGGFSTDIADGIRWAAGLPVDGVPGNRTPARVINLSFGAQGDCLPHEQAAIDAAVAAGALVVAAAGNFSNPADVNAANAANASPGNCARVLTVAALTRAGGRATYSKYDTTSIRVVELAAPGGDGTAMSQDDILAPSDSGNVDPAGNTYSYHTGTSFSAPMVSGSAAAVLSLNNRLSPSCVYDFLTNNTRAFPGSPLDGAQPCTTTTCGSGMLDMHATLAAVDLAGPGDCGSNSLVPPSSDSDGGGGGGGGGWWLPALAAALLSRRRAATSIRRFPGR